MGAWNTVRNYIDRTLEIIGKKKDKVRYIGRKHRLQLRLEISINILHNKRNIRKGISK